MLLLLLLIPLLGIVAISLLKQKKDNIQETYYMKLTGFFITVINLLLSLYIFIMFDFSTNQYQFVQENHNVFTYDFYLGLDGLSIYFVLLTTIIMPIALLSN